MRIGIILQARMGSTRLPGKILMPIGNKRLLEHILYRLTFLQHPVTIVIATTEELRDDPVEAFCAAHAVVSFRGSEDDVLDRFYQCAEHFNFDHVIRLTGDNPFPDIEALDDLINLHLQSHADYTHSFDSLPVGVGAEIFTRAALERSWHEGQKPHHREHVNEYMLENPEMFKTMTLPVGVGSRHDVRLTVDTAEDYRRAGYIVTHCPDEYVSTAQAIVLAEKFAAQVNG